MRDTYHGNLVWWPSGLRFLATYGLISLGHMSAQVRIMSSFHLYISFHLTLCVTCVPLESPLAYDMYLFNLRTANHILIKIFEEKK